MKKEINAVYQNDVDSGNRETFLHAVRYEYQKNNELSEDLKEMAYELISEAAKTNPSIVLELKNFNTKDSKLLADTMRHKTFSKRK